MRKKTASPLIDVAVSYACECSPNIDHETQLKIKELFTTFLNGQLPYHDAVTMLDRYIGTAEPLKKIQAILSVPPTPLNEYSINSEKFSIPRQRSHPWTTQEDQRLLAAIHKNGPSDWAQIAYFVGNGRTRSQCSQRWHRTLDPHISKERWTEEDDQKLFEAVRKYGESTWTKVAQEVGGRTDVQCRYRYQLISKRKQTLKRPKSQLSYDEYNESEDYIETTRSDSLSSSAHSPIAQEPLIGKEIIKENLKPIIKQDANIGTETLPIFSKLEETSSDRNNKNEQAIAELGAVWQYLFSEAAYRENSNEYDLLF